MKRIRKLLFLCVLTLTAVLSLCSCAAKTAGPVPEEEIEYIGNSALSLMQQIITLDEESLNSFIEDYEESKDVVMQNGLNSWKDSRSELGGLIRENPPEVTVNADGSAKAVIIAEFENRNCEFILGLDKKRSKITELTFNPVYSMGEKMSQALVNLAVGMGTVFAVLIFLTWVISMFKYVKRLEGGKEKNEVRAAQKAAEEPAEEPVTDDLEIEAVIAAAIMAYEADQAEEQKSIAKMPALENGIRVRSYRHH